MKPLSPVTSAAETTPDTPGQNGSSGSPSPTTPTPAPDAVTDRGALNGVNLIGFLRTESGVGAAVRGYLRALRALGIPIALKDVSELSGNRAEDRTLTSFDTAHPYDVNLVCGIHELQYAILERLGEESRRDRYNIGIWAWELPRFPEKYYDRFVYYDEIWVYSSFIANALSPISPIPIVRIPPPLTAETLGSRERGRRRLNVSDGEFVYLFIFDFHSLFPRKNPLALIDAFKLAFAPSDPVRLVIKCVNGRSDRKNFAAMSTRAHGYPIDIHDGYWPAAEIRDLMAACDAYASLHRSEGLGLTITDAMAHGKPVIATGWSGNMDFMNVSNSFPVRFELVEIERNVGPYRSGETWARPSEEHAAELMRLVFEDRQAARVRGQAARREIEATYSEQGTARLIQARLAVIASRHRFSELKRELASSPPMLESSFASFGDISRYVPRFRQLAEPIREVVRGALPPDATVIVVSKGDDALLRLDGRRAWHFPQTEDGAYAGYYPADSDEAIDHLEALRARGAGFLLLPYTALWWLDHYAGFRQHLEQHYHVLVQQADSCTIYRLN